MIAFTEEQIEKAYEAAPQAVKEAIEEGAAATAVFSVSKKHSLHVDMTGTLAGMASSLLLGLLSPTQFVEELEKSGVGKAEANTILQELNDALFKPLLTSIQKELGGREVTRPPSLHTPLAAQKTPLSAPVPLVQKPTPAPQTVVPQTKPETPVLRSTAPQPTSLPPLHTMALDVKRMSVSGSKSEGSPLSTPVPLPPKLTPLVPPRPPMPPGITPITKNQPDTRPARPQASTPKISHTEKASGVPTHEEVSASLKQYGIDPYREPVE